MSPRALAVRTAVRVVAGLLAAAALVSLPLLASAWAGPGVVAP